MQWGLWLCKRSWAWEEGYAVGVMVMQEKLGLG